ncbi:hypothetical protein CLAFUR4_11565 [Fulvia fulva]|nr:hypothetical protein CLAFUR4_11565 [Fulvia fulva]WPV32575.1 hypothetical protein CLAFUW7_11564 [Fulvia fulva]
MVNTHSELADAQDRFSRVQESLLRCIDDRRDLRAELEAVRDELVTLDEFCRGPGYDVFIDRYRYTQRCFEDLKEDYAENTERIRRLEAAAERAEDEVDDIENRLRREREQGGSRSSRTHRHNYSSASPDGGHHRSSHSRRHEGHEDSRRRHRSRETRPDFDSSRESRQGPSTYRYHYGYSSPFSHREREEESSQHSRSERYEDSSRGYYTRVTRPDFASSSRSARPDMPRDSHSRHESRRHGSHRHGSHRHESHRHESHRHESHRHDERTHHSSHRPQDSSRARQPPPNPTPEPTQGPSIPFPPSMQTIAGWRKNVDQCFADYSKIEKFPRPPVSQGPDWAKNLKTLLLCLEDFDLKKERLRWHPDKFSNRREEKREEWKGLANDVFCVVSEAKKEREG